MHHQYLPGNGKPDACACWLGGEKWDKNLLSYISGYGVAIVAYIEGKAERKERVLDILRKVKLSHRAKHYPHQLSGGQQQRVAIARAVVGKPSIILADEPTGNLDSKNGMEVMQLLSELNEEGTTIVMVTHSKHDATYANRIINLFDGQVVDAVSDQL